MSFGWNGSRERACKYSIRIIVLHASAASVPVFFLDGLQMGICRILSEKQYSFDLSPMHIRPLPVVGHFGPLQRAYSAYVVGWLTVN